MVDWKDTIVLQKHWIDGECDGFSFDLNADNGAKLNIWTKTPEHFECAAFIAITEDNVLNKDKMSQGILDVRVENPFTGKYLPVIVTDEVEYPLGCDTYLGLPAAIEFDREFAVGHKIPILDPIQIDDLEHARQKILTKA